MSIADCFKMEFHVARRFLDAINDPTRSPDFATGVDHVLVKKEKGPAAWMPATLADVSDDAVDWYFRPFDGAGSSEAEWRPFMPISYEHYPTNTGLPSAREIEAVVEQLSESATGRPRSAAGSKHPSNASRHPVRLPTISAVLESLRSGSHHFGSASKLGMEEKVRFVLARRYAIDAMTGQLSPARHVARSVTSRV